MVPNHSLLVLFLISAIVLLVMPGPSVFYIVGRTIGSGRRAGFVSALGIGLGALILVAAAAMGLSAILLSSALVFGAVKYLGAAYLIYLGVQKLRGKEGEDSPRMPSQTKLSSIFCQGILVELLNPKTALFIFAFLPQFVDIRRGHVTAQILFLGVLFAVMGVMSDSMWALLAGTIGERLRRSLGWRRAERSISGGILISLGVAAALAGSNSSK
jgi:threonine/homoserine/homoserine lactone efflux protein